VGGVPAERAPPSGLPCLNSNISIEEPAIIVPPGARKTAFKLTECIKQMASRHGVEHLAFFTVTFPDPQPKPKEAARRMNSLNSNVISKRYVEWIAIYERGGKGLKPHFHLLVATAQDIRTGCDFEAIARGDYSSANQALKAEWKFWRQTTNYNGARAHLAPYADIGRTELLPIKSTTEGIRKYVGKYVEKHMEQRLPEDKGVRLLRMSRATSSMTVNFAWHSPGATLWRLKLAAWCKEQGYLTTQPVRDRFGPRWAYLLRDSILSTPLPSDEATKLRIFPTVDHFKWVALASRDPFADEWDRAQGILNEAGLSGAKLIRPEGKPVLAYDNGPNAAW